MKTLYFLFSLLLSFVLYLSLEYPICYAQTVKENYYITNGDVTCIAAYGNTTYLGGYFTYVGPYTGGFVKLDKSTGKYDTSFIKVDGSVLSAAQDNSGGWYISGHFTGVNGTSRNNLAHIKSNGEVDLNWDPAPDNYVNVLAFSGNTLYAVGEFTSIGGASRIHIAALDENGRATSFNPNPDGQVLGITLSSNFGQGSGTSSADSVIYVYGSFNNIGGQARKNIAALDRNGNTSSWDPSPDKTVYAVALKDSIVYAAGVFNNIGGQKRNFIAALDKNAKALPWNPDPNDYVDKLAVSDSLVYASGKFITIGGKSRHNLAALDMNGNAAAWDPNPDNFSQEPFQGPMINAMSVSDSMLYVTGIFTSIGGQERRYFAAIDRAGKASAWNPYPDNTAFILISPVSPAGSSGSGAVSNSIFAGGPFVSVNGVTRNHIAALDQNGKVTGWDPNADKPVGTIAVSDSIVYAAGIFTSIGGQKRNYLAALSPSDGKALSWDPNPDGAVRTIAISNQTIIAKGNHFNDAKGNLISSNLTSGRSALAQTIYIGGEFKSIGSQPRNYLAAIDQSGNVLNWNPQPDNKVLTLAVSDTILYAGGDFTSVTSQSRKHLAAFNLNTGQLTSWDPGADSTIQTIAVSDNSVNAGTVYIGGHFSQAGGKSRNNIAAIDQNGQVSDWNPNADLAVRTIALAAGRIYAGGDFSTVNGQKRNYVAALDKQGQVTSWNPDPDRRVLAIIASDKNVYIGGQFTRVGNSPHSFFAVLTDSSMVRMISVSGKVTYHGAGMKGLKVSILDANNVNYDNIPQAKTDSTGHYQFLNIPAASGLQAYLIVPLGYYVDENPKKIPDTGSDSINFELGQIPISVDDIAAQLPKEYKLYRNFPNPFNPETTIKFDLPKEGFVMLKIYDAIGREVSVLINEAMPAGRHQIKWNASEFPSGMYILRIESGSFSSVQKLMLLR